MGNHKTTYILVHGAWCLVTAPPELIRDALSLQKHLKPFLNPGAVHTSASFLSQTAGEVGLFAKLKESVNFGVRRVLAIGAFFDENLAFRRAIRSTLPEAEIVVGIDPDTVYLPILFGDAKTRFVDTGKLWLEGNGRYLHARAVYIEGIDSQKIFLSGSANPSGPGWGLESSSANTEAVMLLKDANARDALSRTGLDGLFDLPALPAEILKSTTGKASQLRISTQPGAPRVVVGTADGEAKRITVGFPDAQFVKSILPLDDNDRPIPIHLTFAAEASTLEIVMEEGGPGAVP